MNPPQQPAYYGQPPAPYYYGVPPQKAPSRVAWFFIGAGSMFTLGVIALFGFFMFIGFLFEEGFDDPEDGYYYVDQSAVVDAVEGPCANMRSAADEIQLFSDPKTASADITGFTLAIRGIVDAIDAHDPNSDAKKWRDDWKALSADLDTYAGDLATQGSAATFSSLTEVDDEPTIARMSYSSEADCEVPRIIEALDPDLSDYWG